MSKTKIYKIEKNNNSDLISFIIGIVVYAIVLVVSANLFESFYLENFLWAIVAALILSSLNYTIKPILIYLTLPLTIVTFGIAYPIVNMIILKICDLLMGNKFVIVGFFSLFFIAVFISLLKILLDTFITKNIGRR